MGLTFLRPSLPATARILRRPFPSPPACMLARMVHAPRQGCCTRVRAVWARRRMGLTFLRPSLPATARILRRPFPSPPVDAALGSGSTRCRRPPSPPSPVRAPCRAWQAQRMRNRLLTPHPSHIPQHHGNASRPRIPSRLPAQCRQRAAPSVMEGSIWARRSARRFHSAAAPPPPLAPPPPGQQQQQPPDVAGTRDNGLILIDLVPDVLALVYDRLPSKEDRRNFMHSCHAIHSLQHLREKVSAAGGREEV